VQEPTWKRYLTDHNEGLGVVYERLVLNDYLDRLVDRYAIESVLEAPLYGMAGVSGINSVQLARRGCRVTLVDWEGERLAGVQRIWQSLRLPVHCLRHADFTRLPFEDGAFDMAWEWAGLWYLPDAAGLLRELVRVSRKIVFVAMPNPIQVGYLLRKYAIERDFFRAVDERWTHMGAVKRVLRDAGAQLVEEGVMDVPPWPDTVMPAAEVLKRLGISSRRLSDQFSGQRWAWSTMAYYLGEQPDLRERVLKYAWLDRVRLPWQIKLIWAHHWYVLGAVGMEGVRD
jgi:SAM-dependent methyltransferase